MAKKRKLSPKQIAIFGTPRQKAALRRKRNPGLRNAGKRSTRKYKKTMTKAFGTSGRSGIAGVYSKHVKTMRKAGATARRKRRKNVGQILSILNPGRKRRKVNNGMARRRRKNAGTKQGRMWSTRNKGKGKTWKNPGTRRRRRSTSVARRRRTGNPSFRVRRVRRVSHRRRSGNPGSFLGVNTALVPKALGFLGGMIGARYLTQMVLGGNNSGYVGYAGNVAASVVLGLVTGKVTKNKELGNVVLIGGIAGTILRVVFDKTQYGSFISNQLGMSGKGGDIGIGMITDSSFPVPQVAQPGSMNQFLVPRATRNYVGAQAAQTATLAKAGSPGMGSMVGRRARGAVL